MLAFRPLAFVLAMLPLGAAAPTPVVAPACAALPPELAGWVKPTPLAAVAREGAQAQLALGRAVTATLPPTPQVRYPLRPEKPGDPASHGGVFAFTVTQGGRYRVALGAGAWIDVVKDGKALASVAHGHGPECAGVRKMVDFDLAPARYTLQIAGNGAPTLTLMVVRLPR